MSRLRRTSSREAPTSAGPAPRLPVSAPGDAHERQAETIGERANSGAQFTFSRVALHAPPADGGDAVQERLQQRSGRGLPLAPATRTHMESQFGGADFGRIRIHTDDEAGRLARTLGAQAFTYGRDIYAPSGLDRGLLAHELAHTLQQESSGLQIHRSCHTVAAKETLTSIATQYGVSVTSIAEANEIRENAPLPIGTFLVIPDGKACQHTVAANETLYKLSQKYKTTVEAIKTANNLTSDTIKAGDVLTIGVDDATGITTHTVALKETLFSIAKANNITVDELKAANGLKNNDIVEGQVLKIPKAQPAAPAGSTPKTPTPAKPPATTTTAPPAKKPPATTPATPPATTTAVAASASADPGHNPGKDYSSGKMRERSFLRDKDRKTKLQSGGADVFFESGASVKLLSSAADWVEVEGEAFTNPAKPVGAGKQKGWVDRSWTTMTLGDYKDIPVEDLTGTYGKLSAGMLAKSAVNNVILHQTGSPTGAPSLAEYQDRIKKGRTIGAHYLIDESGSVKLVVPVNQKVSHVGKTKPGFETAGNPNAIGIEHSGKPLSLDLPSSATDATTIAANRTAINAFAMSPDLKARVTGMTDKELYALARANGDSKTKKWFIYGDINAKQKRATYNLASRLMTDFKLDEGDFLPHETVSWKTIGEGENIKEFLTARAAYPGLVKQLADLIKADAKLSADAGLSTILTGEQDLVAALAKDTTESENKDLAAERASKKPGAASTREDLRVKFYEKFWTRSAQLAGLVAYLKATGSSKPADLAKRIAAWKK